MIRLNDNQTSQRQITHNLMSVINTHQCYCSSLYGPRRERTINEPQTSGRAKGLNMYKQGCESRAAVPPAVPSFARGPNFKKLGNLRY